MNRTLAEKVQEAIEFSERHIENMRKELDAAVKNKNWQLAAEIKLEIIGANHILQVFKDTCGKK